MFRQTFTAVAIALISTLLLVRETAAQTALNRAVIESLRNQVQLLQENRSPRNARVSDVVVPGNGVSTARRSFAELRFNDGSLGRLGEQVVFWFAPGSRDFRLSNGTILLLIPPGQGRTNVRTPNATAGIQGSALFVRYIAETDTTVVGALTDSGIQVQNQDGSEVQTLRGGQMAVTVGDRIRGIYEFDLRTFYETSQLVRGVTPQNPDIGLSDTGIAQVQEEMRQAIAQQPPLPSQGVMETPDFVRLSPSAPASATGTIPPSAPQPAITPAPSPDRPEPDIRESGLPGGGERSRPFEPGMQPGVQPERQPFQNQIQRTTVDPRRDDPVSDRPGRGGNGRPGRGGSDDRPGNDDRPGRDSDRPGRGGSDDRPGNGRPGRGNNRPDDGRPGNGNGRPGNGNPGNGNPGNGRPGNGNPGNGNPGNGNPGNGNGGNGNPGNGNNRPGTGN